MMSRHVVIPVLVDGYTFHLHEYRVPEGYEGYVVWDGNFFCVVPTRDTRTQFLDSASERINELIKAEFINKGS